MKSIFHKENGVFILLRFRLLLLLCLFCCLGYLPVYGQNVNFNLDFSDVSLKKVLKEIEKQSNFHFIYNDTKIRTKKKISIKTN